MHEIAEERVGWTARKWTIDSLVDVGGAAAVYHATSPYPLSPAVITYVRR